VNLFDLQSHSFLLKSFGTGILLAIGAGCLFAYLVGVSTADAHTHGAITYPPSCCNSAATSINGDCAPIDSRYVTGEADGFHINLPVGSHPKLKTKGYSGVVPYSAVRQPLDHEFHICLSNDGANRYCFFAPPMGS
jgi:hypothetical protein